MTRVGSCFGRSFPGGAPLVALALLLVAAVAAPGAAASRQWCRTDPVVTVGGVVADVFVSGPLDAPTKVTGPNLVRLTVPAGVDARLVASDLGFGRGVEVSFAESHALKARRGAVEVRVEVYVPAADDAMPVLVEFAPRVVGVLAPAAAEGTANRWVALGASL